LINLGLTALSAQ